MLIYLGSWPSYRRAQAYSRSSVMMDENAQRNAIQLRRRHRSGKHLPDSNYRKSRDLARRAAASTAMAG